MRTLCIALSALVLASGSQVAAQSADGSETLVIRHDDLNLASEKGQKMLEGRIERAVRDYCGAGAARTGTRVKSTNVSACVQETRAAARAQMSGLLSKGSMAGG